MTDVPVIDDSSYVPEPRPSDDRDAQREAALQALARRGAPTAPPGAVGVLTDRVLLHTSWDVGRQLLPLLPAEIGGLVLRGSKAGTAIKQLDKDRFDRPLVLDPEGYLRAVATEDMPFPLAYDGEDGLFGLTLEQELQSQRDAGACVALTPTGYLRAGDSDALRAAVHGAEELGRDDLVLSVPLDVAWFTEEHISHLVAVLARLQIPKAVFLGGQFDPMKRYKDAVANLRRLVAEAGDVAVLRTDFTGFDALSRGAFATSIGSGGSLRHVVPFGQISRSSNPEDTSPSVLFGELMTFYKGSTLQDRFANVRRAPTCDCAACQGRPLDTFLSRQDQVAAHQHNMCTWAAWITELMAQPTLADRASWWRNRCVDAVARAELINSEINQPEAFTAKPTLQAWAELPSWWSVTQPSRKRSRSR